MTRSAIPVLSLISLYALVPCRAMAVDFDKDIKPILKANCYECHSEESKKEKAGFVFDNKSRLKKDIGPNLLIEPGQPGRSHLLYVVTDPEAKNKMPPKKDLEKGDIEKLRTWIAEGANLEKDSPKLAVKKDLPIFMTWINIDGKKVRAGFGGMQGENVVLKMPDGKMVPYPMAKLSAESQTQAKECAAP
jgi:hypothetical protein